MISPSAKERSKTFSCLVLTSSLVKVRDMSRQVTRNIFEVRPADRTWAQRGTVFLTWKAGWNWDLAKKNGWNWDLAKNCEMKLGFSQKLWDEIGILPKKWDEIGILKKMRWNWDFGHEKLDRVRKRLKIVMMFSNNTVYYSNNRIFRDKNYIAHTQLGKKLKKMIGNAHRASHDLDTNWNAHPRSYHPPKYQIDPGICCWTILSNRETVRICRVKLQNRDGNYIQGSKVPCPWIFHVYPTQARNPTCLGVCELIQQIHLFHLVLGKIGVPGIPGYPLVNIQKTMENHHFQWKNPL